MDILGKRFLSDQDKIAVKAIDRMMIHFAYGHLPDSLADMSRGFAVLAIHVCNTSRSGPERTVALRKLLEARDAAVRSVVNPGC